MLLIIKSTSVSIHISTFYPYYIPKLRFISFRPLIYSLKFIELIDQPKAW